MGSEESKHVVDVVEYTDPYCTWCWGAEPVLRKIKELYGNQVEISFKMGGLVKDIGRFYDPLNKIGGTGLFEQVAEHWAEASRRHGMPVDAGAWKELAGDFRSSYPANIAYKAAQMQNHELATKFLRRMREAAAAERKAIHRQDVQAELAREVGLDPARLLEDLESGRAEKAFHEDLRECRAYGITGFPTFQIRNVKTGKRVFVTGYREFDNFDQILNKLSADSLTKRTVETNDSEIAKFVERWGRVATQEVATVFDLDRREALGILTKLEERGLMEKVGVGEDYFWSVPGAKAKGLSCDTESGTCSTI